MAMSYLATKYAIEKGSKPEDLAAGTVIASGAILGGQSVFFAYQDYLAKRKVAIKDGKPDERAVNPTTGKPTPGAPVQNGYQNGGPSQVVQQLPRRPGGPIDPNLYG
jgi:hypothetical protein